ncbi:hypothetical protein Scep_029508 [Stephania cephalantha]|uniref:Uncharacterized protein n=1 Tax=Stephania cephalantha TaxID=152367 RepID=A0AAP0HFN8_9MAGN
MRGGGRQGRAGKGGDATIEVDMGDQLANKDPVDLDPGIDYGVVERVVRSEYK